eukprot:gene10589-3107_t
MQTTEETLEEKKEEIIHDVLEIKASEETPMMDMTEYESLRMKILRYFFVVLSIIVLLITWIACGFVIGMQASFIFVGQPSKPDVLSQVISCLV